MKRSDTDPVFHCTKLFERKCRRQGRRFDLPSNISASHVIGEHEFVVLGNVRGFLAAYRRKLNGERFVYVEKAGLPKELQQVTT